MGSFLKSHGLDYEVEPTLILSGLEVKNVPGGKVEIGGITVLVGRGAWHRPGRTRAALSGGYR